jgi:hypothetical protein
MHGFVPLSDSMYCAPVLAGITFPPFCYGVLVAGDGHAVKACRELVAEKVDHLRDQARVADLEMLGFEADAVDVAHGAFAHLLDKEVEVLVDPAALVVQLFELIPVFVANSHRALFHARRR